MSFIVEDIRFVFYSVQSAWQIAHIQYTVFDWTDSGKMNFSKGVLLPVWNHSSQWWVASPVVEPHIGVLFTSCWRISVSTTGPSQRQTLPPTPGSLMPSLGVGPMTLLLLIHSQVIQMLLILGITIQEPLFEATNSPGKDWVWSIIRVFCHPLLSTDYSTKSGPPSWFPTIIPVWGGSSDWNRRLTKSRLYQELSCHHIWLLFPSNHFPILTAPFLQKFSCFWQFFLLIEYIWSPTKSHALLLLDAALIWVLFPITTVPLWLTLFYLSVLPLHPCY